MATTARAPAATASVTVATKPGGRHAQDGEVDGRAESGGGRLRGRVRRLAEHLGAAPVDQQHRSVAARGERPPTEDVAPLRGVVAGADDRHRAGREQGVESSGVAHRRRPLTRHGGEPSITD